MGRRTKDIFAALVSAALATAVAVFGTAMSGENRKPVTKLDKQIDAHARQTLAEGRQIFRFETFGDEAFWGDTLLLHQAIKGAGLGGVGPGVSPSTAVAVGLKTQGGFYHDGSFPTLFELVGHYDAHFGLNLTEQETSDLIEYLMSL